MVAPPSRTYRATRRGDPTDPMTVLGRGFNADDVLGNAFETHSNAPLRSPDAPRGRFRGA